MLARARKKLTVEEFYDLYEAVDERYELVDGEVWSMSGGTAAHSMVSGNLLTALNVRLRGSGCRTFNSDMGLRLGRRDVRYPDVSIYCSATDLERDWSTTRDFSSPAVVMEVLSPSTEFEDRRVKVAQYQAVDSLRTIVLVDPVRQRFEMHRRAADGDWEHLVAEPGSDLVLDHPAVTITAAEMFEGLKPASA